MLDNIHLRKRKKNHSNIPRMNSGKKVLLRFIYTIMKPNNRCLIVANSTNKLSDRTFERWKSMFTVQQKHQITII